MVKRWIGAALLCLALPLSAQIRQGGMVKADGSEALTGTVTTTGTLASGQVALGSGATSITSDSGCTWTGTGSSFVMNVGGGVQINTGGFGASGWASFWGAPNGGLTMGSGNLIGWDSATSHAGYNRTGIDLALSRPSTGLLLVEDGSGNPRDVQARTGTFGTSLIVGSEAALFNTYKGANSDGGNLFIGGGGQSSVGAVGETYKGSNNMFLGFQAGYSNTTGYQNTSTGFQAGYLTTTGDGNAFSGYQAGYNNVDGAGNTFNGAYSGFSNTSGTANTAVGKQAGYLNTIGSVNTNVGQFAGYTNSTGSSNTWIGRTAGYTATGSGNVGLGYSAGRYETGSDAFYVNNVDQVNTAGDKAYSLLYGTFAGTAGTTTGNTLTVNGKLGITSNVFLSSPSAGTLLVEDGSGNARDVQARTGTFGTSVVTPLVTFGTTVPASLSANASGYVLLTDNVAGVKSVVLGAGILYPNSDNTQALGTVGAAWSSGLFGTALYSPLLAAGQGKTGTNVAGTNSLIQAEPGTGSATGSSIVFQTPTATGSGTTAQTQTTRLTLNESGVTTATGAVVGGVLNVNTSAASNVNAAETDLITYSIPANTLNANGRVLRITAWGTTAANATSKTVILYFGATAIATAATTTASLAWKAEGIVVRTGSNAQVVNGLMQWLTVNVGPPGTSSSTTETDSGAITVKCTGTGGASNDITQTGLMVEALN